MKKTKEDILWEKIVKAYETDKIACALSYLRLFQANFEPDIRCWSLMADIMIEFCRFDEAQAAIDKAWQLAQGDKKLESVICSRYGNFYREKGDHAKAVEWYQKAVDIDCGQDNLVILGTALFQMSRFDEARSRFEQAIAVNESTADEAYFNLGSVFFVQEDYDNAQDSYQKALKIESGNFHAKAKLADIKELKNI